MSSHIFSHMFNLQKDGCRTSNSESNKCIRFMHALIYACIHYLFYFFKSCIACLKALCKKGKQTWNYNVLLSIFMFTCADRKAVKSYLLSFFLT